MSLELLATWTLLRRILAIFESIGNGINYVIAEVEDPGGTSALRVCPVRSQYSTRVSK